MAIINHNAVPTCATCHISADGAQAGIVPTAAQACYQCHGGTSEITHNGAEHFSALQLAAEAPNMHGLAPTAGFTWSADATTDYLVLYNASTSVCPSVSTCTYSWSTGETGVTGSHLFSDTTTTTVTLTLTATPGGTSTYSASVTPKYVASTPTQISITSTPISGYAVTANYSLSGGVAPYTVKATWGDGYTTTATQSGAGAGSQSHTYLNAGTYTVTVTATDSGVNGENVTIGTATASATIASISVSGKVTMSDGTTPLSSVSLSLQLGGLTKKTATTAADGTYAFTNVAPGSYTVAASKSGYTFTPLSVTVLDTNITNANIAANAAAPSVNVSGKVTRSNGITPVAGVSLSLKLGGLTKKIAATATDGTYTFTNVANGTGYSVTASKSGYIFASPAASGIDVSGTSVPNVNISAIAP